MYVYMYMFVSQQMRVCECEDVAACSRLAAKNFECVRAWRC